MDSNIRPALSAMIVTILVLVLGTFAAACGNTMPNPETGQDENQVKSSDVSREVRTSTHAETQKHAPTPESPTVSAPTAVSRQKSDVTSVPQATPAPAMATMAIPTATVAPPNAEARNGGVAPDPDYERALRAARLSTSGWETDFSLHTVPYSEIRAVIPRDNIPSIDTPKFVEPSEASAWLRDVEPVVLLEVDGDARAYPLQIMTWHEIVNDVVGDVPVAITFCPLCNSAIAFDRILDGAELEFGVSGNLRNSDLIMYDRQTHSWWQQFTGEGIVGKYAGRSLEYLPASIVSFEDFRKAHADGKVLSRDTGYARQYGRNPYAGYDSIQSSPFLFTGDLDGRLLPTERVIAVTVGDMDVAFPLTVLQEEGVINYSVGERQIAVFHKFGTTSALDASTIADSRDIGAAGVFDAQIGGQTLSFSAEDGKIVDVQTGSVWDILGNALDGPLAGQRLTPIVHGNHFWFAWAVFKPETVLYKGAGGQ